MKALNDDLLEQVLDPDNLQAAWKAVKANRGAAGIDGIGTEETAAHLRRHWSGIRSKLLAGRTSRRRCARFGYRNREAGSAGWAYPTRRTG